MNFCSVEEAWGSKFNSEDDSVSSISASTMGSKEEYRKYQALKEKFEDKGSEAECLQFLTHINKCSTCREKFKESMNQGNTLNDICKTIINKIKSNSDVLTLVLLAILAILVLKLFFS